MLLPRSNRSLRPASPLLTAILTVLFGIALVGLGLWFTEKASAQAPGPTTVDYTPSTDNSPNPERGFYRHTETHSGAYVPLNLATLQGYRSSEDISLILRLFYLDDFTTGPISPAYLAAMETDFNTLRQARLKAVVRFAYTNQLNFAPSTTWPPVPPYGDASEAQILAHLDQLRPLLYKHRDVIAVVQAGFIGIWGEWYYTDHFVADPNVPWIVTPADYTNRGDVLRAILAALPVDRMAQVRTPLNKQKIYGTGTGAAAALVPGDAHNTSNIARTGHHNDCFLASDSDFGTYSNITEDKNYLAEETKYLAMGGETCNPNPPRSLCATALAELAEFHWSYLNAGYHPDVLSSWSTGGCLEEVKQRLGYRLSLLQGIYDNAVKPGGEFTINLDLRNDGWAAPYNPRLVELLLRNPVGDIYSVSLPDDPRTWLADGSGEHTINHTVCVPVSMPVGSYDLLLHLADPEKNLHDLPEYAIRLANTDVVWEAGTGYNDLGHSIVVDSGAISPDCASPLVLRPQGATGGRIIQFAGQDWFVKSGFGGPGPNNWADDEDSVWVDNSGRLHLKMRQIGDTWYSAEVTSVDYTQEGVHRFYVTTPDITPGNTPRLLDNLDKNVVFAPFVYAADNLEVDMEFTRFGQDAPGYNAQYVIQPDPVGAFYTQDVNLHRFLMNLSGTDTTHLFDWRSSGVTFESFAGHTTIPTALIQQKTLTGGNVPSSTDNLRIHINLWLYQGNPPSDGRPAEIIVSNLEVEPADTPVPPDCSNAQPSLDFLWPPNHKFVNIDILGVTDPDGDPISIAIDSIFQDEPLNGTGDGDTSPDGAGVGTLTASVRAERAGNGNGRVYHIGFTADDGNGGRCSAEVTVGVPKSQGKKGAPVDDGALFDSTLP